MTGLHEAEDLYHILGVAPNVTPEKIKEQFRFLAQAFHPDKHVSPAHKARASEMLRIRRLYPPWVPGRWGSVASRVAGDVDSTGPRRPP